MSTRLVHFSDIHLFEPRARWRIGDYFSKRMTGYVNSRYLPRSQTFRQAARVLELLVEKAYDEHPDLIVFTGDATTLGVEEEFALAARLLRVGEVGTPAALAVPGNHDYYSPLGAKSRLFEKYFAPWMTGERVDEHLYPFGRRVGPLFVAAVNSCRWNWWSWDSTGEVGTDQLARLEELLASPSAEGAIKILVTHYPITLATGIPEARFRRLRDLDALLQVAVKAGVQLWLHGHRHHSYVVPATPERPITALCVGSGTMSDHWSYGEYEFEGHSVIVRQFTYRPEHGRYVQSKENRLELRVE